MEAYVLAHEPAVRLVAFAAVLTLTALWEVFAPRRARPIPRKARWPANIGIVVLNTLLVRLVLPTAAVGIALAAKAHGWGLFNHYVVPAWAAMVGGVMLLDFMIYMQHVMFHSVPALWRLHRMHHADLDIDVTTGSRFHPVEIVLSMLIKFAAVAALGVTPAAVVLFEVLLNASSMFNHANVRIPLAIDRRLRWLIVTPDMHRVHHSIQRDETDSNFAFNLALWDRLFGTYRAQPEAGHVAMTIGIPDLREPAECSRLLGMLAIPFKPDRRMANRPLEARHESR